MLLLKIKLKPGPDPNICNIWVVKVCQSFYQIDPEKFKNIFDGHPPALLSSQRSPGCRCASWRLAWVR